MKKNLLFLCTILFVASINAQTKKAIGDKIIAQVGDQIILYSEIQNAVQDALRLGEQLPPDAECLFFQQSFISKLLMLQAIKDSIVVTDDELDAEFERRINAWRQSAEQPIDESIIRGLKESSRNPLRESMLSEAVKLRIIESVRITPEEVKKYFESIPKDSLPYLESEYEIAQIVIYPKKNQTTEVFNRLDSIRARVISGLISFESAATEFSEMKSTKFYGPYFLNYDGTPGVPIARLDKSIIDIISKINPGTYSMPEQFIDEQGRYAMRIVYFKSRSEPHVMNLKDDYVRISNMAKQSKQQELLFKWVRKSISAYHIEIDEEFKKCKEAHFTSTN